MIWDLILAPTGAILRKNRKLGLINPGKILEKLEKMWKIFRDVSQSHDLANSAKRHPIVDNNHKKSEISHKTAAGVGIYTIPYMVMMTFYKYD